MTTLNDIYAIFNTISMYILDIVYLNSIIISI